MTDETRCMNCDMPAGEGKGVRLRDIDVHLHRPRLDCPNAIEALPLCDRCSRFLRVSLSVVDCPFQPDDADREERK